jgi:hypothetical protein
MKLLVLLLVTCSAAQACHAGSAHSAHATTAAACPFCTVVGRPLAARRDAAAVVAVGEVDGEAEEAEGVVRQRFVVRGLLRGEALPRDATLMARVAGPVVGTAVLFGDADGRYQALAADETLLAYVATAPPVEAAAPRRLAWFARWLEHPERGIAEDAFLEFGLADFDEVVAAAGSLDAEKLRRWIDEPAIDQGRRGFYGLAVGILSRRAATAGDIEESRRCIEAIERSAATETSDLRAGFDGLLGGLLVARGQDGIGWMIDRGLLAAETRAGDARHALAALRFAWEYLAETLPRETVAAAAARLLANPAVAADATVDLARWEHWQSITEVAPLWDRLGRDDPLVRRAVAGYLIACPLEAAREHVAALKLADAAAWQAAVVAAGLPPSIAN